MVDTSPGPPRILVAGCGAIGGIYAAHLSRVAQVVAYDTNAAHVEAIHRNGLRLAGKTEMLARIEAVAAPTALAERSFDAVIVAVKSMHTDALFRTLRPVLAGRPLLFTLQNGQGNVELLLSACDWDVLHGMTWEGGEYEGPGCVRHLVHGPASCAGPARGSIEAAGWLGELIDSAGLPTRVVADARGAIWSKFIFNSAMNPVAALVRGIPEAKYRSEEVYEVLRAMVDEGKKVAERLGITLQFDPLGLIDDVRNGTVPMPSHPGSMAQDIERGTPTEIDALTGYMVRKAAEVGVAAPAHALVYRLLKGLEFGVTAAHRK